MPAAIRPAALLDVPMHLLSRMAAFGRSRQPDHDGENGLVAAATALSGPVELDVDEAGRIGPSPVDERPAAERDGTADPDPAVDLNGVAKRDEAPTRRNGSPAPDPAVKPAPPPKREGAPRPSLEATIGPRLDRTLMEIRRIAGHLEGEEERNERMVTRVVDGLDGLESLDSLESLSSLSMAVAPLPEIGREGTRLLGVLGEQFERTTMSVEALGASIQDGQTRSERLADRSHELLGEQTRLLGGLHEAIGETTTAARDTGATLEMLENAADRLAITTDRLANALQKASESARSRELRMTTALDRTHRWTVTAIYVCGGIATLALIGVGLVLAL